MTFKPYSPWYRKQSLLSDSIKNIILTPPKQKSWDYIFNTPSWFSLNQHSKILGYPQPISICHDEIEVVREPIEITPLETFRVELKFPTTKVPYTLSQLDGILIRPIDPVECNCQMAILMRHGCQCGGV